MTLCWLQMIKSHLHACVNGNVIFGPLSMQDTSHAGGVQHSSSYT